MLHRGLIKALSLMFSYPMVSVTSFQRKKKTRIKNKKGLRGQNKVRKWNTKDENNQWVCPWFKTGEMFQAVPKALPEEMRGSIWEHIYVPLSRDDPKMTATSCIILGSTQDKHSASLWTKLEIRYLFKQARHSSCFHSFQSMICFPRQNQIYKL